MTAPEKIKNCGDKTCRSRLHHFTIPRPLFKPAAEDLFDVLGGVMMVSLAVITLALMRLLIAD